MRNSLLAPALLLASAIAAAQTPYPPKPVRIIVPSSPGGSTDITTRALNLRFTKLNEAVVRAVREPAIRKRFAGDGVDPVGSTPEEFARLIRDDIAKWHRVVKQAGSQPE